MVNSRPVSGICIGRIPDGGEDSIDALFRTIFGKGTGTNISDISDLYLYDFRGGEDRKEEGIKTEERPEGISQEGQGERIRAGQVQVGWPEAHESINLQETTRALVKGQGGVGG